ncbi:MAG: hypothetical protein ATN35_05195 [Epulopiscium sp. Nele67-Bin004]|nr:MAG: hypothetical protein ATN35_05195 [Epulopiscium sp. Nele67-Bin004]
MNNKSITYISIFFVIMLLACCVKVYDISINQYTTLSIHDFNPRMSQIEEEVVRGNFYDTNGIKLTENINNNRVYVYQNRYAHTVGYTGIGEYGLEKELNLHLLAPTYSLGEIAENFFFGEKFEGRDIYLTLDNRLQQVLEQQFVDKVGAAVVIEPSTGKIKAMYCAPTFNPNSVYEDWEYLISATDDTPLVNRATQGLYPPGSIFKVVPTIALMEKYPDTWTDISYTCLGKIEIDGNVIRCYNENWHGKVTIDEAFAVSCNTFFINLLNYITPNELEEMTENLLFNIPLPTDIYVASSSTNIADADSFSTALSYMGQGQTLVTPFHMAMLASMVANEGILMSPYIVDYIQNTAGYQILKNLPSYYEKFLELEQVLELQRLMESVVASGTAVSLNDVEGRVGVKTGTAQNETSSPHSWVMGYIIEGSESLAFAIIVENQEGVSLDIAESLLHQFLANNRNY